MVDVRFAHAEQVVRHDYIAHELLLPVTPTFGFHGLANMWRYVDDDKMLELTKTC